VPKPGGLVGEILGFKGSSSDRKGSRPPWYMAIEDRLYILYNSPTSPLKVLSGFWDKGKCFLFLRHYHSLGHLFRWGLSSSSTFIPNAGPSFSSPSWVASIQGLAPESSNCSIIVYCRKHFLSED
jgi:hypothetical protein